MTKENLRVGILETLAGNRNHFLPAVAVAIVFGFLLTTFTALGNAEVFTAMAFALLSAGVLSRSLGRYAGEVLRGGDDG